jgi:ribonuclease BN (tRNA processing enzyme)
VACLPERRPIKSITVSHLQFLGTGPGSPVPGKLFSSCVLKHGASIVLVDAGEPCSQRLVECGISSADIDAVLLTHAHSDHTAGLPMLLQSAWLAPRRKALPVYLPGELILPLEAWLRAVYLPSPLLGFELSFLPWSSGRADSVAPNVEVMPFPTTHLEGLRRIIDPSATSGFEVFGLDVRCGGKRVVFSSDLGSPADLAPVLGAPCDVLVCELSHFEPAELFSFLDGKNISTLILNHLAPELTGKEGQIAEEARRALPALRRVVVPEDGETVEF